MRCHQASGEVSRGRQSQRQMSEITSTEDGALLVAPTKPGCGAQVTTSRPGSSARTVGPD
jgi:hypothetical protein